MRNAKNLENFNFPFQYKINKKSNSFIFSLKECFIVL